MASKWWTLTAVALATLMFLVDITIVNVALPDIQRSLGASLAELQWIVDAYPLALAALLLTAGSLGDRLGRRRVHAVGIAVFTVGSLLCGLAGDPLVLALARLVQGVGGAAMSATGIALLANAFRGRDRGTAFGVFGAVTGLAVASGPVLGGVIISGLSWRWIFFVNIPLGLVALAITLRRVAESRDPAARRPDWPGVASFSTALALLVLGLIRASEAGWGRPEVLACELAAAALLVLFVRIERRHPTPMFDLGLLRTPSFVGGLLAVFCFSVSLAAVIVYLVLYLQDVLGFSALETGLRLLPFSLAIAVAAAVAGKLTSDVPARWLIAPGLVLVGVGLALMHGVEPGSEWTDLLPGLIVAGIGDGLLNTPLIATVVGVVRPAQAGMASGSNNTMRQVGTALGIALLGAIFASTARATVAEELADTPAAGRAGHVAERITAGDADGALAGVPGALHGRVADAATAGYVHGLNTILLVAAVIALAAAVASFFLIRRRDLVPQGEPARPECEPALA
jgi:EmrB/QacA subfamily drug resistance transporter